MLRLIPSGLREWAKTGAPRGLASGWEVGHSWRTVWGFLQLQACLGLQLLGVHRALQLCLAPRQCSLVHGTTGVFVGTVARGSWEGPEAPLSSATSETSLQSWVQDVRRTFLPIPPPPLGVQDFQQSEAATDTADTLICPVA